MANSPYVQAPLLGTYYYMFNTTEPPLDDIRVRRAMAMAIDRETLADTVLHNTSLPAYSFGKRLPPLTTLARCLVEKTNAIPSFLINPRQVAERILGYSNNVTNPAHG